MGHQPDFLSVTTGKVYLGLDIPEGGLRPRMFRPYVKLELSNIFQMTGGGISYDSIYVDTATAFITQVIKSTYPTAVRAIFKGSEKLLPTIPQLDKIPIRRVRTSTLAPVRQNEGTTSGTLAVHDHIFLHQYGLDRQKDFDDILYLVYGDQKTVGLCRRAKLNNRTATLEYDRRTWLIAPTALFHLQMNFLWLIQRTHFDSVGPRSESHTLHHSASFWGRKGLNPGKAPFHILERLVMDSWAARVVGLMYTVLHEKEPELDLQRQRSVSDFLSRSTPQDFLHLVHQLREKAFTAEAWRDETDMIYTGHVRFLQEGLVYLTMRHAIRAGDIGFIRRVIHQTIFLFQGSGQVNYASEMLHLRWLLSSEVSDEALQRAILTNSLVWSGRVWLPIDLALELQNGEFKEHLKVKGNSTFTVDHLLDSTALSCGYVAEVKSMLQHVFGLRINSERTERSVAEDVHTLAHELCRESLYFHKQGRTSRHRAWDIYGLGAEQIAIAVDKFNERLIKPPDEVQQVELDNSRTNDLPPDNPLADIHEAAEAFEESQFQLSEDVDVGGIEAP